MTNQERLDDARNKYHLLTTGQLAKVFVDQNGERIEFNATNSARLAAYIRDLERLVEDATPIRPGVVWL